VQGTTTFERLLGERSPIFKALEGETRKASETWRGDMPVRMGLPLGLLSPEMFGDAWDRKGAKAAKKWIQINRESARRSKGA
jgi:hypothetical protein